MRLRGQIVLRIIPRVPRILAAKAVDTQIIIYLAFVSIIYQRVKKIKKLHFGLAKLEVSV